MWRSLLFMPVLEQRFIAKAAERGADAIVLDLEASIAAHRKEEAREKIADTVEMLSAQGLDVLVRINSLWLPGLRDLQRTVTAGLSAVVIPTCNSATEIIAVDRCIEELEVEKSLKPGKVKLIPIIETARGVRDADSILRASDRTLCVGFGTEDYMTDMGATHSTDLLTTTSLTIAQAARAAGVIPLAIPESLANLTDIAAFESAANRGRALGSEGGFCAHPDQVAPLNRVFTPSAEDVQQAERIVAAAKVAEQQGLGAARLDDRMIDGPVIVRAQKLLERAKRYTK